MKPKTRLTKSQRAIEARLKKMGFKNHTDPQRPPPRWAVKQMDIRREHVFMRVVFLAAGNFDLELLLWNPLTTTRAYGLEDYHINAAIDGMADALKS